MEGFDYTELQLETEFLWGEISVGDSVMLDADLYESDAIKLQHHHLYQVVAKLQKLPPKPSLLVVESNLTGELIQLHPALICSYQAAENNPIQS